MIESIMEVFLAESTEQLDEISNLLVDLEDRPGDKELIEQLQRAVHNLKGASGTVGHVAFAKLLHTFEDVTQLLYREERPDLFNRLFSVVDVLRESLGSIAAGKDESQQLEEAEQQLLSWLLSETQLKGQVVEDYKVDPWKDGHKPAVPEPKPTVVRSVPQQSLRVGVTAMDNLVDLIGELVIVESMIVNATQKNGEAAPWARSCP